MASLELTPSQTSMLTALVILSDDQEVPVKGDALAAELDRASGTIRNQMQSLRALGLVEGIPGPKGGYKPTATAYEALGMEQLDQPATVLIRHDGDRVDGATVEEIRLTNVHHPERCRAEIRLRGSLHEYQPGDAVRVGPTPLAKLVIAGRVAGKDEINSIVILEIERISVEGGTD